MAKASKGHKAACVIGWPVTHSRSPLIHNYWIKKYKVDAEYRREEITAEKVGAFIRNLRDKGYVGANVTIPHKEAALMLSKPDDRGEAVGAANTLWYDGDILRSTNTDVEGFLANMDSAVPGWDRGLDTAVVLGSGGAARAVIYALLEREVERIHLVNRSFERARTLQKRFGDKVHPVRWTEMTGLLGTAGLIVNATSLGMSGQRDLDINLKCGDATVVADLVYDPLETTLLKTARERGMRVADGLGMLLHQAVGGFERWFGIRPEVTAELRELVQADLRKK